MGRKIFVSYKYADSNVENLNIFENSTVRNYVDKFEEKVAGADDIFKGESDGEDLSYLSDDGIWEELKNRIYDSSVTIVFISPGMRETGVKDREQWIPWEISYSLKETSRRNKSGAPVKSRTNAMIAVVLPDSNGSYSYYLESKRCFGCFTGCVVNHTEKLFEILKSNMFNKNNPDNYICSSGDKVWRGECSYIEVVKWNDFISNYKGYVDKACERQNTIDDYEITKEL